MKASVSHQVSDFIEALPQPQRSIAEEIRDLLLHTVPGIEERFSFKLPFYHYYGMFCYLHVNRQGLHLCFYRGKDLAVAFPQLEQKNRAAIASVTLFAKSDLHRLEVPQIILAAALWNKEAKEAGVPMVRRRVSKV